MCPRDALLQKFGPDGRDVYAQKSPRLWVRPRARRGGSRGHARHTPAQMAAAGRSVRARGLRESAFRGELARGRRQLTPALPPATVGILSQFFRQCFLKTCRLLWFWKWAKTVPICLCNPVLTVTRVLFLHSELLARLLLSPANDIRLLVLAVSLRNPFGAYFFTGSSVESRFAITSTMAREPWFNSVASPLFQQTF